MFCELFEISVDEVHLLLADTRRISDPRCAKNRLPSLKDIYNEHSYCCTSNESIPCDFSEQLPDRNITFFERENARTVVYKEHNYTQLTSRPASEKCQGPPDLPDTQFNTQYILLEHNYAYKDVLNIRSLNINGLKSKLLFDEFIEDCCNAHVSFFQETKTDNLDEDSIRETLLENNLDIICKHRKTISKHRSGGMAVVYNTLWVNNIEEVLTETKEVQWVTMTLQGKKILFGNCYFPPEGSKYHRENAFDLLDIDIISICIEKNIDEICLLGDFNARTNTVKDYIDNKTSNHELPELDFLEEVDMSSNLDLLEINKRRENRDKTPTNKAGKRLIECCKNYNILIANGRVGFDQHQGNFTTKDRSTIDYIILSPGLLASTITFDIEKYDPILSNVHKCINLSVKFANTTQNTYNANTVQVNESANTCVTFQDTASAEGENQAEYKVRWNEKATDQLRQVLPESELEELNDLSTIVDINDLLDIYTEKMFSLYNRCDVLLKLDTNKRAKQNKNGNNKKPWFNNECQEKRKVYSKARRKVKLGIDAQNELSGASRDYKKAIRKAKAKFLASKRKEIKRAAKNPKEYWKLLDFKKIK